MAAWISSGRTRLSCREERGAPCDRPTIPSYVATGSLSTGGASPA